MHLAVEDDLAHIKSRPHVAPHVADMIDVAAALHTVDRAIDVGVEDRRLRVMLPVRDVDLYSGSAVQNALQRALRWYSGDEWQITFSQRRRDFAQSALALPSAHQNYEVALWSGGLDSLSGLASQIADGRGRRFLLVGTGSNNEVFGVQRSLVEDLRRKCDGVHFAFSQVQIKPRAIDTIPGHSNSAPRLRGMVFLLIGAAQALCAGEHRLAVYENGIGAMNLPLSGGLVGLDHSVAVHPKSLHLVGRLVSEIAGEDFVIENPYVFNTKAEMCGGLICSGLEAFAAETISCDSKPRRAFGSLKVRHCGTCTSCLLRRQALPTVGIRDRTNYESTLANEDGPANTISSLLAMQAQLKRIEECLKRPDAWQALLSSFPDLVDVCYALDDTPAIHAATVDLYRRYCREWRKVGSNVGSEFGDLSPFRAA